ncbi:MAG: ankyrin repeat domain-containing protein [Dehalococcoidia bacterium]
MRRDFQDAVDSGDAEAVRRLLDEGVDVDARDGHGQTGLMRAAPRGRLEVARALIEAGANIDRSAKYGLTALMLAIINAREEVALALIEAGADLSRVGLGAPGFSGKTALDLARERGHSAVVTAIEGRDSHATG